MLEDIVSTDREPLHKRVDPEISERGEGGCKTFLTYDNIGVDGKR